ncbi:MAG: hypothetical protein ACRDYA_12625 [Egibacteraceae bacterium]
MSWRLNAFLEILNEDGCIHPVPIRGRAVFRGNILGVSKERSIQTRPQATATVEARCRRSA